ncbi:unnamed protein product [Rotaria sp. Silwood1]|nr:unnamed protein product [Rotaria sp. Silwood1]CAF3820920.1 unnamed protein product [Rotaria sp. Silwood1]CAF3842159.1 unnamed protein product [Rotaria sp. Silwood1]CAF4639899.1 unnamed protein product [Rotaria sp. Silwood1]CAF4739338.1 unnamed protein product [Rotaria sp. Silwood1]
MDSNSSDLFNKCVSPWFGAMCQYKFAEDLPSSFSRIVMDTFNRYATFEGFVTIRSCYQLLNNCQTEYWSRCLDWREICDGKTDCINGEDEQSCNQLDITECTVHEYRCHYGGQCIPLAFFKDSKLSMDCLDGSDEEDDSVRYGTLINPHCLYVYTFRCEERTGRYPLTFPCGYGSYLQSFDLPNRKSVCPNRRDLEFSISILTSFNNVNDIKCQEAFYCAFYPSIPSSKSKDAKKHET